MGFIDGQFESDTEAAISWAGMVLVGMYALYRFVTDETETYDPYEERRNPTTD